MQQKTRRALGMVLGCAMALATVGMTPQASAAASGVPGDPTITLPINDSEAGGTYDEQFTRVYAGTTPDGTPVYIYVPQGTPLDGSAPTGVDSLDPAFDQNPLSLIHI